MLEQCSKCVCRAVVDLGRLPVSIIVIILVMSCTVDDANVNLTR